MPMSDDPYKSWRCQTFGYVYDERKGDPDEGLAPGTRWAVFPHARFILVTRCGMIYPLALSVALIRTRRA
jgi:rubredoxin